MRGFKILKIAVIGTAAVALIGLVTMELWNWLIPAVFGGHTITYWQSLGLLVLSKILFGGFHGKGHARGQWKQRMRERLAKMTPEEREKFLTAMERKCGPRMWREPFGPPTQSGQI